MDLNNYLTNEESEQMERLLKKAAERRQQDKGKSDDTVSFLFMQYESRKQPDGEVAERGGDFNTDLENVTEQFCRFCQKYRLCDSRRKCGEYCGEDQELPFG